MRRRLHGQKAAPNAPAVKTGPSEPAANPMDADRRATLIEIGRLSGRSEARADSHRLTSHILAALIRGDGTVMGFKARIVFDDPSAAQPERLADLLEIHSRHPDDIEASA